MTNKNNSDPLASQSIDYVTSAAKALVGAAPFVGSLLAELAGILIPNQRIDRIAKFAVALEHRLSNIEEDHIRDAMQKEIFSDLLEEGLRQASRSLSDERREYIATIIANGLPQDAIDYIESKQLLRILGELNDAEIIWLKSHDFLLQNINEFREKHRAVLEPVMASMTDPSIKLDKETLQHNYQEHLSQLGLLEKRYKINNKTNLPEYDSRGKAVVSDFEITYLGRLLLRQIGLSE